MWPWPSCWASCAQTLHLHCPERNWILVGLSEIPWQCAWHVSAAVVALSMHSPFAELSTASVSELGRGPAMCAGWDGVSLCLLSPMWVVSCSSAAAILPLSHFGSAAVATPNDTEFYSPMSQVPALLFMGWSGVRGSTDTIDPRHDSPLLSSALSFTWKKAVFFLRDFKNGFKSCTFWKNTSQSCLVTVANAWLLQLKYLGWCFSITAACQVPVWIWAWGMSWRASGASLPRGTSAGKGGLIGVAFGKLREFWSCAACSLFVPLLSSLLN